VSIIQKVPVSEVAKAVGALWKAMDEEAKAPYTAMATQAKAERDAKIAEMEEALSQAASDDNSSIASTEEESSLTHENVAKHTAVAAAALPKISQFDHSDPITKAMLKGISDDGKVDENASVSDVTESVQESVEEEGEEVEEHELADGTTVLKGDDGTIYDAESFEPIGKWNEADNTLVKA